MQLTSETAQNAAYNNRWLVLAAVMLSTFMEVLDTSVVNVSFPHIAGSLSASFDEATWVLSSYIVANAMVIPLSGWLTDRFGRRNLLLFVVTSFTFFSVACCFANSLGMLVFFRVMQGLTGGGLQSLSQAVIIETFPQEEMRKAQALWGMGVVGAPLLGPALGGWLTETHSWRWIFGINLPIGIISWVMIWIYLTETKKADRKQMRLDWLGVSLLFTGMATLQIALDKGQLLDWFGSTFICWMLFIATLTTGLFIWRQLVVQNPIVRLRLFKHRAFAAGCAGMFILCGVLYASLVLLPEFMQELLHYDAFTTGIYSGPRGISMLLVMGILMMGFVKKFDPRILITFGALLVCYSMFGYAHMNLGSTAGSILEFQLLQGFGTAVVFTLMTSMVFVGIPREDAPYASSLYSVMRNIGSAVGVAFVSTYLARQSQAHQTYLGAGMNRGIAEQHVRAIAHGLVLQGASYNHAYQQGMSAVYHQLQQQSLLLSFSDAYLVAAICFPLIIPAVWMMKRPVGAQPKTSAHMDH